jgi:hypothetical protein
MELKEITTELPYEVKSQLMSAEKVYYFSFIAFKGGCGSPVKGENYWIALTDSRVMYKTKFSELKSNMEIFVEKDGDLPFDKISFIEVSEGGTSSGCSTSKSFQLRISTSGGTVIIPLPTKEKGYEIRKLNAQLNEQRS